MRITLLFILLFTLLSVSAAYAQDEDDTFEALSAETGGIVYGIVNVDRSEVRAGPDFAYPTIGQLPINASIEVIGRAGQFVSSWNGRQWLQVQYGEQRAWVYARLIRTSVRFNRIPVTGMLLPRNANGRVPDVFDLSTYICDRWEGEFTQTGDFMAGDQQIVVSFPGMTGAVVYSVIVITPGGYRIAFDTEDVVPITIPLDTLPANAGTYRWTVVPYWTTSDEGRRSWQQICPLRTGGYFDKPETVSNVPNAYRN